MISADGGLPAHRYTPQVTQRWPRGSEPASLDEPGPAASFLGMCSPRGAMRWSAAGLFRLYPLGGPHVPAPGSISVWRAAPRRGIDILASQGGASPEGHGDRDCAVDLLFLAMVRQAGKPRVHGVACAILHSFLGVPGLQVVRSAYWPGALDATWAPSGPLGIHHGGLARAGVSRVRTIAE